MDTSDYLFDHFSRACELRVVLHHCSKQIVSASHQTKVCDTPSQRCIRLKIPRYGIDSVPTNSVTESDEGAGLARGSTSFHADSFAAGSAWPGNDRARAWSNERSKHI